MEVDEDYKRYRAKLYLQPERKSLFRLVTVPVFDAFNTRMSEALQNSRHSSNILCPGILFATDNKNTGELVGLRYLEGGKSSFVGSDLWRDQQLREQD